MQNKITVIDSIMGSGKTTWAINYMKKCKNTNFLYITPFLDECKRIQESTGPEHEFIMPVKKWPTLSKLENIATLLQAEENIASSHELFKRFDERIRDILLFYSRYTLIIDEVVDVISPYKITKSDIEILRSSKAITIDDKGVCHWNKDMSDYEGRYEDIRLIASSGNLVCIDDTFFIWRYNPEIFEYFEHVYIMTYLFDGSVMKGYFDYYNIPYEKVTLEDGAIVPYKPTDTTYLRDLINIYDGRLNIGFSKSALSKSWYDDKKNAKEIKKLGNNMDNYFRHILEAKADTRLWSTFEDKRDSLQKTRYKNDFIPCNARATNDYANRYNLAYLVNIYLHPGIIHYLAQHKIIVDKDQYALGILLQWIWRSRIRNGEPINLYIPSERMRKLLLDWLKPENK